MLIEKIKNTNRTLKEWASEENLVFKQFLNTSDTISNEELHELKVFLQIFFFFVFQICFLFQVYFSKLKFNYVELHSKCYFLEMLKRPESDWNLNEPIGREKHDQFKKLEEITRNIEKEISELVQQICILYENFQTKRNQIFADLQFDPSSQPNSTKRVRESDDTEEPVKTVKLVKAKSETFSSSINPDLVQEYEDKNKKISKLKRDLQEIVGVTDLTPLPNALSTIIAHPGLQQQYTVTIEFFAGSTAIKDVKVNKHSFRYLDSNKFYKTRKKNI